MTPSVSPDRPGSPSTSSGSPDREPLTTRIPFPLASRGFIVDNLVSFVLYTKRHGLSSDENLTLTNMVKVVSTPVTRVETLPSHIKVEGSVRRSYKVRSTFLPLKRKRKGGRVTTSVSVSTKVSFNSVPTIFCRKNSDNPHCRRCHRHTGGPSPNVLYVLGNGERSVLTIAKTSYLILLFFRHTKPNFFLQGVTSVKSSLNTPSLENTENGCDV